jgi:hypothetical protein
MKFELNDKELEMFQDWNSKHKKECKLYNGPNPPAIGGRLTFSFNPTGLGNGIKVTCVCGAEKDCTDIDNW